MTESLPRVLCVDDEPNMLLALQRSLHEHYEVDAAGSAADGLERLRSDGPFAVVVSDMRMPGMNGAEFLAHARDICPDTVRVLLTGAADVGSAIEAVNRGAVFRYLSKPCPREQLLGALDDAVAQHRWATNERHLLETTLTQSIHTLAEVLAMTMPWAHRRAAFAQTCVRHAQQTLRWSDAWIYEVAAALSQIGCVGVPPDIVQRELAGKALSAAESEQFAEHPETAFRLLSAIPRLEHVASIIRHQHAPPPPDASKEVRRGAELLRAALALERLHARGVFGSAATTALAHITPRLQEPIIAALAGFRTGRSDRRQATVMELIPGWIVDEDVRTVDGKLLLSQGHELSATAILTLRRLVHGQALREPISVRCDVAHDAPAMGTRLDLH